MSFFVGGAWIDAPKGSLVVAPGGTAHDFENRTASERARSTSPCPVTSSRTWRGADGSARARPPRPHGERPRRTTEEVLERSPADLELTDAWRLPLERHPAAVSRAKAPPCVYIPAARACASATISRARRTAFTRRFGSRATTCVSRVSTECGADPSSRWRARWVGRSRHHRRHATSRTSCSTRSPSSAVPAVRDRRCDSLAIVIGPIACFRLPAGGECMATGKLISPKVHPHESPSSGTLPGRHPARPDAARCSPLAGRPRRRSLASTRCRARGRPRHHDAGLASVHRHRGHAGRRSGSPFLHGRNGASARAIVRGPRRPLQSDDRVAIERRHRARRMHERPASDGQRHARGRSDRRGNRAGHGALDSRGRRRNRGALPTARDRPPRWIRLRRSRRSIPRRISSLARPTRDDRGTVRASKECGLEASGRRLAGSNAQADAAAPRRARIAIRPAGTRRIRRALAFDVGPSHA